MLEVASEDGSGRLPAIVTDNAQVKKKASAKDRIERLIGTPST
jgi:hypothetical protein